ncbi:MAG: riboflavin biosynthesis protein RibF [Clostridia bacterium]|nr:riboflavin biosynthesis protein RibF [Clostridia bacterium]
MSVVTVGDFDGVHLGHRALLREVVSYARSLETSSVVITFDRNTKAFLLKTTPYYLTDTEEKKDLFFSEGIDTVYTVPFDEDFCNMSSEEFLDFLRDRYDCTHLFGGSDFKFGKGGEGTLRDGVCCNGICQHVVDLKTDLVKISSSSIRAALAEGLIERANSWLGAAYSLSGTVVEGKHLGRTLGFPTVNLFAPDGKILPQNGVYVTETVIDGIVYRSLTNVGIRPTVKDGSIRNIETHLLDVDGDFYGRRITVRFLTRLRDEIQFSDLGELMRRLRLDKEMAFSWHNRKHFS